MLTQRALFCIGENYLQPLKTNVCPIGISKIFRFHVADSSKIMLGANYLLSDTSPARYVEEKVYYACIMLLYACTMLLYACILLLYVCIMLLYACIMLLYACIMPLCLLVIMLI